MSKRFGIFLLALLMALFVGVGISPGVAAAAGDGGDGFSTEWGEQPSDHPQWPPQP